MIVRWLALLVLSCCLLSCDREATSNGSTQTMSIQWHKGNVDKAFAQARAENKPLFFYWGAVWCPPCQEIQATVFKHPKFISQSQLFVPVYLDGDTEQAQLVGERFAVQGYPTMVVFNSAGNEITRIPGGIDTRRYLDVLSLSLNDAKNMNQLIAQAKQAPQSLSDAELTQLAFYSWSQGNVAISDDETLALLKSLALQERSTNNLAVARLLLTYLSKQIDLQRDELSGEEKQMIYHRLQGFLHDDDTVLANIDFLSFYAAEIISLLALDQQQTDTLTYQWTASLNPQRDSPLLSKAEKLGTWLAPVNFYWLQHPDASVLPQTLSNDIVLMVERFNNNTEGDERQSVINRAGNVLRAAKLYPQAKELIAAELDISKSPYYFMSSMAEIAEETGDGKGAVEWRKKAYEAATGKATRFQWGVEYVSALIEYQPDRTELIAQTTWGLFDDLDRGSDVFTGRNYGRLNTLLEKLKQWRSEDRENTVQPFVSHLQILCEDTPEQSRPRQQCRQLLTSL